MGKSKVVVDTNVLISGYVFGGKPKKAIKKAFSLYEICVSPQILKEYRGVPKELQNKNKINSYQLEVLIAGIASFVSQAKIVIPKKSLYVCRDKEDNMLLECCLTAKADFLVTQDKDLLEINISQLPQNLQELKIITPVQFIQLS